MKGLSCTCDLDIIDHGFPVQRLQEPFGMQGSGLKGLSPVYIYIYIYIYIYRERERERERDGQREREREIYI